MLKSIVVAGFLPEIHICSWILVHFRCLDAFKPQVSQLVFSSCKSEFVCFFEKWSCKNVSTNQLLNQPIWVFSAQMDRNVVNYWVWSSIKKGIGVLTSCLLNFFKGTDFWSVSKCKVIGAGARQTPDLNSPKIQGQRFKNQKFMEIMGSEGSRSSTPSSNIPSLSGSTVWLTVWAHHQETDAWDAYEPAPCFHRFQSNASGALCWTARSKAVCFLLLQRSIRALASRRNPAIA